MLGHARIASTRYFVPYAPFFSLLLIFPLEPCWDLSIKLIGFIDELNKSERLVLESFNIDKKSQQCCAQVPRLDSSANVMIPSLRQATHRVDLKFHLLSVEQHIS